MQTADAFLSTREAAELAGVGPTSVKRWADLGLLVCQKTAGGHRRFERGALERFLGGQGAEPKPLGADWADRLVGADAHALRAHLFEARSRLGAWHRVADELAPAITELGARWQCGDLTVLEEHVASERLTRALAHVADSLPFGSSGPRCLLACAEGDEHTLGLSLAELCLREAGWGTVWAGRGTPSQEVVAAVERGDCSMVALSASSMSPRGADLARQASRIAAVCRRFGVPLALGGSGAWPEKLAGVRRFTAFAPFYAFVLEVLSRMPRRQRR